MTVTCIILVITIDSVTVLSYGQSREKTCLKRDVAKPIANSYIMNRANTNRSRHMLI